MDLGLERAGWSCAWQVESDPYARRILTKHWEAVPRFEDVRGVGASELAIVDMVAGGFPCQDLSAANVTGREGLNGSKSGLWSEFGRIIEELRPKLVLVENIAQGWRAWVPFVRRDLWRLGYASLPVQLCAGTFGAWHRRPRCFVVAHANRDSESLEPIHGKVASLRPVARARGPWRTPAPGAFRVADGLPGEMDQLRGIGNAVVPQVAEWLGRQIKAAIDG